MEQVDTLFGGWFVHTRVWVGWAANPEDNWDIYAKYGDEGGFSPSYRITFHPGADLHPSLTSNSSGQLWAFWQSFRDGDANIYVSHFDRGSWSAPFALTSDSSDDLSPAAAPFGSTGVIVTWRSNRGQHWDIWERHLVEGSWSQPEMISTEAGDDISPVICSSPQGDNWLAWSSSVGENWEIYASCHRPVGIGGGGLPSLPTHLSLFQNYPNPFNSSTLIRYHLSAPRGRQLAATLKVYNILGQEVRTLMDERQPSGGYQVLWDGRDNRGKNIPSGIYLYRLAVQKGGTRTTKTRKMISIK